MLDALAHFDTCTITNAIETFQVRLRNTGFSDSTIRSLFPDLPPMVGYATTARVRTEDPPARGGSYHDRTDWWNYILSMPSPRIVVLEDMDKLRGVGAFLGDVHGAILRALGCVGFVTNGAVRELPGLRALGLQLFAGHAVVSHSYAHIFEFGATLNIGGLKIQPGDLLHGDQHGLITIPKQIASGIPSVAAKLKESEEQIIRFCQSREFSVEKLRVMILDQKG
ncbi:MAG TPA: RraA family protein [Candidatus Angelobacter sp.]|nr:RraA family protein [Candidatus Angelobacter sp.]